MNKEIFEKYRKFQDKFDLPEFYELERAFKLEIKNDDKLIDMIRNEVSDRIFNFSERILEPLFNDPDALCCIFEQNMISDNERETLFEVYKKIQALKWENNYLIIYPNDNKTAEWIKKAWDLWNNQLQADLASLCKKFSLSWTMLRMTDEKTHYHG